MATINLIVQDFSLACLQTNQPDACDDWAWQGAYYLGYREPRFPVPALSDEFEISGNYLMLSMCPHTEGPCNVCVEKFLDGLEWLIHG